MSMEFVAKPEASKRLQYQIPSSLAKVLGGVKGFGGCLVMVSDREARLVTVVTLWTGEGARERCAKNAHRVASILEPFLDRQCVYSI